MFFDVDRTLLRVQSIHVCASWMRRQGHIGRLLQLRIAWAFARYRLGMVSLRAAGAIASEWLSGRPESQLEDLCAQCFEEELRDTFDPAVVARLREHEAAGHPVALLTAGTRHITAAVARAVGVPHVIGSELEVRDGILTGEVVRPLCFGKGKIRRAEAFAAEHGIDLDRSWFYSDSFSDLPMLERVGHPVLVQPDPRLRAEALRRGWPTLEAAGPCES